MDILVSLLSSSGPEVWAGCEPALHSIMAHFAKEFRKEMVRNVLIDYCNILTFCLFNMCLRIIVTTL